MIDNSYLALKEKIFAVLNNGISIVSLADKLCCTPSALQLWFEGEDNVDLNTTIYAFLVKEKVKDELLNIPFLRISPFIYIENVIFEAMYNPGIYALIGSSGIGKTASLLECVSNYENIKFLYSPEEIYKLSIPNYSVICIDNAEELATDQADIACRYVDKDVSVILSSTSKLIEKIASYEKLALKTVIRDVPGIDEDDIKRITEKVIGYALDESVLKNLNIISIPSIARLVLILKEAYRLVKKSGNSNYKINNDIITEAKKSIIILEGAKW